MRLPRCFGGGMVIPDDCVVSCAYWEECEEEAREREEKETEAELRRKRLKRCQGCGALERGQCLGCDQEEPCRDCHALKKGETPLSIPALPGLTLKLEVSTKHELKCN